MIDIAVEAYSDGAVEHLARRLVGTLWQAAIASDLAEHAVERHRGEGQADHAGDEADQRQGQQIVPGLVRFRAACSLMPAHFDEGMGDVGAKPDDGDHEEQHEKRRERPGDGERTHALAALALGFVISDHEVQSSGIELWLKPKPCSTRSAANNRNRYKTE